MSRANKPYKIPGEGTEFAKLYETLPEHVSDNEYLYYIHFRLGAANSLLQQIRTALYIIAGLLTYLLITLWYKNVI